MPGQTPPGSCRPDGTWPPFNGGPSNCPAKPLGFAGAAVAIVTPSMEGRAIARPNAPRPRSVQRDEAGAFNGGPSNCPAKRHDRQGHGPQSRPFNGGPSNCPAKQRTPAGSSPRPSSFNGGPSNCPAKLARDAGTEHRARHPSMEGRAIARPNSPCPHRAVTSPAAFNGGPSNCPAKPAAVGAIAAGCLSFNGGPSNCPAKRVAARPVHRGDDEPSMEGRAIARPNR